MTFLIEFVDFTLVKKFWFELVVKLTDAQKYLVKFKILNKITF